METEQVNQELHLEAVEKAKEGLGEFLETGDHTVGGASAGSPGPKVVRSPPKTL